MSFFYYVALRPVAPTGVPRDAVNHPPGLGSEDIETRVDVLIARGSESSIDSMRRSR